MITLPPYARMLAGWSPNDTPKAQWWTLAESATVRDARDHTPIAHGLTVRLYERPMGCLDADLVYVGPQRPDEDFDSGSPGILDYCHRAEDLDYPDDEPTLIIGPGWYVDTAPDEGDGEEEEA